MVSGGLYPITLFYNKTANLFEVKQIYLFMRDIVVYVREYDEKNYALNYPDRSICFNYLHVRMYDNR